MLYNANLLVATVEHLRTCSLLSSMCSGAFRKQINVSVEIVEFYRQVYLLASDELSSATLL